MTLKRSIRTVDLRLAIAEYYGFDFQQRVRRVDSNSHAAVYFSRGEIDVIAEDLGIDADAIGRKTDLLNVIREECGRDPRDVPFLNWEELEAVIQTVGIPVADDVYYDLSDPETWEAHPPDEETADPDLRENPWSAWERKMDS